MELLSIDAQARGLIAIGSEAEGVIAIGQVSQGVIAIGQSATGVIAIGQDARGVFAVGQLGIGVWTFSMVGLGVLRAWGFFAMAARASAYTFALSILPVRKGVRSASARSRVKAALFSILPDPQEQWKPDRECRIEEIAQGTIDEGWVRGSLSLDGHRIVVNAGQRALEGCEVAPSVIDAARKEFGREGWLYIERREKLGSADEGGFRKAPTRAVTFVVTNAQWPERISMVRRVLAVIAMLVLIFGVTPIALVPVAKVLMDLVAG